MATQVERTAASRARLLDAAVTLFAERGVPATSVAEIGARAGLSRGAVNFHFGSKDAMLGVLVQQLVDDWERSTLLPELDNINDLEAAIDALLYAHRRSLREDTTSFHVYYALLFESLGSSPQLREHFARLHRQLRAQISAFINKTQPSHNGLSSDGAAIWFLGALRGIVQQYLVEPEAVDLDLAYLELKRAALARYINAAD